MFETKITEEEIWNRKASLKNFPSCCFYPNKNNYNREQIDKITESVNWVLGLGNTQKSERRKFCGLVDMSGNPFEKDGLYAVYLQGKSYDIRRINL